ncbi:MAG: hypothetical protein ACLFQX_07330 [Candidatus Kapaibacterium sp.]
MKHIYITIVIFAMLLMVAGCGEDEQKKPEDTLGETPQQEQKIEQGDIEIDTLEEPAADVTSVTGDEVDDKKTAMATADNPMQGYIVSIDAIAAGREGRVSKSEAVKLANDNRVLGFMSGSIVYLLYEGNGAINNSKLANMAAAKNIGVIGKVKSQNGVNYIIVDKMRAM